MLRLLRSRADNGPLSPPAGSQRGGMEVSTDPLLRLAEEAAGGASEAQRTLLVAVGPALLRIVRGVLGALHADVEDTLQEAMVAVHLALPGFRGECSTLHFACRIAVQTAMNARRRAGYRTRHTPCTSPADLADVASDDQSPIERLATEQRREALRQLLCDLPDVQAEVLALHMLLGYTVEETALAMSTPVNTVRSRLRAALDKLRTRVQGDDALLELIRGSA